jgi:hypothetical protein
LKTRGRGSYAKVLNFAQAIVFFEPPRKARSMSKSKTPKPYIITCPDCGNQYGSRGTHRCAAKVTKSTEQADILTEFVKRGRAAQQAVDAIIAVEQPKHKS